jgi:A/G-specific adenine glycosylase
VTELANGLLSWFIEHGRKTLPWQSIPPNGYHVWLSEVMLQQTQVKTVIDYFNNFIKKFPDITSLANASEDDVLAAWAGLGYYSRARNLHKAAQITLSLYGGILPKTYSEIIALPGVGRSTAGAILSLTFNQPHAILDGNVKRVMTRYHRVEGHYSSSSVMNELWRLAELHIPAKRNAKYTQAIMDIGATICTPKKPGCKSCPISKNCGAFIHNQQDIYPNKKPVKTKPERNIIFIIYKNEKDEIYLKKRPSKGIWGGLWSFVECSENEAEIEETIISHNPKAKIVQSLTKFKHAFSHYTLWISPIIVSSPGLSDNYYKTHNITLGVPAPVKKILHSLDLLNHR